MGDDMNSQYGWKRIHVDGKRVHRHFMGWEMTPRARWYHQNSMARYERRVQTDERFISEVGMCVGYLGRVDGIRFIES